MAFFRLHQALMAAIIYFGVGAYADTPLIVGDTYPIRVSNNGDSDITAVPTSRGTMYTVTHPGASYIALHFADINLVPASSLEISDGSGEQSYILRGRGKMDAGSFWSQHIKGDTVVLHMISLGKEAGIFTVDEYAAGFTDMSESVCGTQDTRNAVCYATTHPTEYATSQAVARLLIAGTRLCTGWLASSNNHLITNEHCISEAIDALNTDYEFMAEASSCELLNCQLCHKGQIFSGATFIRDSVPLDYALVQITTGNPVATYGYLQLDIARKVPAGEAIYIPQYPNGRAKELGIFSTHEADAPTGLCNVNSLTSYPCSGSGYNDFGYYCDTEGGSSGSPVISRVTQKVIALHHCRGGVACTNTGGDGNRGVPISLVYNEISSFISTCVSNSDCDDGIVCTIDTCNAGTCSNVVNPNCCTQDSDCNDGNMCTSDTCIIATGLCFSSAVVGCCSVDLDCSDGNACTTDSCNLLTNKCTNTPTSNCCGNGLCEIGENCSTCAKDCISGVSTAQLCGNGICDAGNGENCVNCPQDCRGVQSGSLRSRYCCGNGGQNPVGCSSVCKSNGFKCSTASVTSSVQYCCGDGVCSGDENCGNCPVDCRKIEICNDGVDNDCDGTADCNDADCATSTFCAAPTCKGFNQSCASSADCCSKNCKSSGVCGK